MFVHLDVLCTGTVCVLVYCMHTCEMLVGDGFVRPCVCDVSRADGPGSHGCFAMLYLDHFKMTAFFITTGKLYRAHISHQNRTANSIHVMGSQNNGFFGCPGHQGDV